MLRKDLNDLEVNGKKGDWCFCEDAKSGQEDAYICLMWGDDPFKNLCILPIKQTSYKTFWNWNGSKEAPTLTPSILVHPAPGWQDGWHGYLTDGKLITC